MAKIINEQQDVRYNGKLLPRLLGYAKPYIKQVIACLILVLALTAVELERPILIGDAIDLYIEGYNEPYGIVNETENSIEFEGQYYIKGKEASSYAQLLYDGSNYYFYTNLTPSQSDQLYEISQSEITNTTFTIDGEVLEGKLLSEDECKILRQSDFNGVIKISILYAVLLVLGALFSYIQTMLLQRTGQNIIYTIRDECFKHVHSLPLRYFDTHPVGRIVTRITNDVESLHELYANILSRLFKNVVKIIGLVFVMLSLNVKLAICAFVFIPFVIAFTLIFRTISRKVHRNIRTKVSLLNTFLSENISGMKMIQIFAKEDKKYNEFKHKSLDLYHSHIKQLSIFAFFRPLIYMIGQLALCLVLYEASKDVLNMSMTMGTAYIFVNYISSFYEPIQDLAEQFSTIQNAFASSEKIFTLLDETNEIIEKENPIELKNPQGHIEFKNVWFAYEDDQYVLKNVSFEIEPGKKVAFVGATGAGKSSILNLIGRYYDIQKGEILIDGINIKDLSIASIRKAIGQVQQDVFLFTGTIASNITLDDPEITEEMMKKAAQHVNASNFIEQLPDAYHHPVSERGSTLSAGQRQLISFSRTLAYNPKILVLDEATSNIDTESELLITDALEKLMEGRTTIMVAHRLSTIQHADKIMVMDHGEIKESGTHQELLSMNGIYKNLYEIQLQKG